MDEFKDKVVLVTGGGSGIGQATALQFAARGARVMICGRDPKKLEETVAQARSLPGEVAARPADISEAPDMQRLYRELDERWGRLDSLFAHAGINGVWARVDELTPKEWARTLDVNLTGTFYTVKYAAPLLKRQGGSITITSSINGTSKFSDLGSSAYSASKAGQIAFMRLIALELAEYRIRVNAICPGSIATSVEEHMEMRGTRATEELAVYPRGGIPLSSGKPGQPDQVAAAVLFLASRAASHITGATLRIDGGQSLLQG